MNKKLYVISTPIGNLEDITFRAINTLKTVDIIICEDTRITSRLLRRYEIQKTMKSYNAYNENQENIFNFFEYIFKQHSIVAHMTDNGTPSISDPGVKLINYCDQHDIEIIPIPGASAAITAISISGFESKNSLFYGFLPNKKGKRANELKHLIENEKKIIVFYESPYRLLHFFEILSSLKPNILVCLCKELTKKYEEILKNNALEIQKYLKEKKAIKGEYTIVINNKNH